jgi:hypothetical protein
MKTTLAQIRAKTMSFFSDPPSVESLFRLFQIVAIVAGTLAVLALIGKDVTSGILSQRNAREMLRLQKELADARTRQAEAEAKLEIIRKRQAARGVSPAFVEALKKNPAGEAVVVYVGGTAEVVSFAEGLREAMNEAGWQVPPPTQINSVLDVIPRLRFPSEIVILSTLPKGARDVPKPLQALHDALASEGFGVGMNVALGMKLPDNRPRVIINPR